MQLSISLAVLVLQSVGAFSMPTAINSGYYSCVGPSTECTVPTTKTTLNVQNMINSAIGAGNISANFTAVRLTFIGFLSISAPTTTAAALPVHITLEDAFTNNLYGSSVAMYFIEMRGKLSSGSSIHIKGGLFIEKLAIVAGLLRIVGSFELSGGSAILVENIVTDNKVRLWEAVDPTVITGGSSVEFKNCTVAITRLQTFYFGLWTLSDRSTFAVRNCTVRTDNPGANNIFVFVNTVSVSTSSLFEIAGNTMVHTSTSTAGIESIVKFSQNVTVATNAQFRIVANCMSMSSNTATLVIYAVSELAITGGGELEVSRNNFTVSGVSMTTILYCSKTFPVAGSGSKLTIDSNVGAVYYSSVVTTNALLFFFDSLALTNSTFSCSKNEFTITATQIGFIYVPKQLTVSGATLNVDGNTVSADHLWTGPLTSILAHLAVFQVTTISSASVVSISGNSLFWNSTASDSLGLVDQALGYFQGDVVVSDKSVVDVSGNTIDTRGLTKALCMFSVIRCPSLQLSTQSRLSLERIVVKGSLTVSAGGNTAAGCIFRTTQPTGTSVALSGSSAFSISRNHFICNLSSLVTTGSTATLLSSLSAVTLASNSIINISHNYVGGVVNTKVWTYMIRCELGLTLQNSQLIMFNATVRISFLDPDLSSISLLNIPALLSMSDGSTLRLATFTVEMGFLPETTGNVAAYYMEFQGILTKGIDANGGSVIEIVGLTLQSTEPGNMLYAIRPRMFIVINSFVSLNESSSLRISDNYVASADRYESTLLYLVDGMTSVTLTGNASLAISGNTITAGVSNTTVADFLLAQIVTLFYMDLGATFTLSNNTIVRNMGMARVLYVTKLRQSQTSGPITVSDNTLYGIITSSNTNISAFQVTETVLYLLPSPISPTIIFSNNTIVNTVRGSIGFSVSSSLSSAVSLSNDLMAVRYEGTFSSSSATNPQTPTVLISGNNVTFTGSSTTTMLFGCMMSYFKITSFLGGRAIEEPIISLFSNTLTSTGFYRVNGFVLEWATSASNITPFIVLSVDDNTVVSDSFSEKSRVANLEGLGSATSTRISLITCGNVVDNQKCHETAQGTHSCVSYSAAQVSINDCETQSHTPSPTASKSRSSTPLSSNSPTPTDTRLTLSDSYHTTTRLPSENLTSTPDHTLSPSQPNSLFSPSPTNSPTYSPVTHSPSVESTPTRPPSATLPPTHTTSATISQLRSASHATLTGSRSQSINTVNPAFPCRMGCAAVTSTHLFGVSVAAGPCSRASIPFEATRDESTANVVMYLNDDARQRINTSVVVSEPVPLETQVLTDSVDGSAVLMGMWGLREGSEYREVWLHVQRVDVTPLNRLKVRVALPAYCFLCRYDSGAVGGGLPWVDVSFAAPPALLSGAALAVVTAGAAASSLLSTDLQTVAAMGMLGCAPRGDDSGESDNVRALVPVSLGDTCEDALWGALITMTGMGVLSAVAVLVHRRVKGQPWTQTCAAVYSPSVFLSVWGMLQMGLVVCGGRLVQQGSVVIGMVGLLVGVAIVPCYIVLAQRVISRRCYRLGLTDKAPRNKFLRVVMYVMLPRFELNKQEMPACKAFTVVVGRTRYRWSGWAGLWVMQPVVMLLCVFAKGDLCLGIYVAAAACLGLLGLLHLIVRPHRTLLPNLLNCIALLINGGLVLVGSMLAFDPLDLLLRDISYHLSLAQTVLTVIRTLLTVCTFLFMRLKRQSWFQAVSSEGTVVDKPEPIFEVRGWLDGPLEVSASPAVGLLALEGGDDDDDLSSISTEAVPLVDRGGCDVESLSLSYQHTRSDEDEGVEMNKIDAEVIDAELVRRHQEHTHEDCEVKDIEVAEEYVPPPPPRKPPVIVTHQISKLDQRHLPVEIGVYIPGDQGPSATSVIGGLAAQGSVIVRPDEMDALLQDYEGEVIIHNHVYDEKGTMVATSAGGARVQALDAESAAYIPVPHPPNYVRPCASDTARQNLTELVQRICEQQRGMYAQPDAPMRRFK